MQPTTQRRLALGLASILVLGFALRSYVSLQAFYSTMDTSTVGLMACHILEGARPLFFYGQSYMGALEAYLAALLFAFFGHSTYVFSLSTILFSLAWIASAWLLVREVYGDRAGLAAALVLAVPGWHAMWYSIGPYGGYPGGFFFGTLALWLAVRLWTRRPDGSHLVVSVGALGAATGLALWTNFQSAPWLLVAAALFAIFVFQNRSKAALWSGIAVGGVLFLLAVSPILATIGEQSQARVLGWSLSADTLSRRIKDFIFPGVRDLLLSREPMPGWWQGLVAGTLAVGVLLYVVLVARARSRKERWLLLAPVLFGLGSVFICLASSMADERAPRYLIPALSMAILAPLALPARSPMQAVRLFHVALLLLWTALHLFGDVTLAHRLSDEKETILATRDEIVEASARLGHPSIFLVGGDIFGHYGQAYNFHSAAQSRFVSCFDERHQPAAQHAETGPYALATQANLAERMKATLDDLGVTYSEQEGGDLAFFSDLDVPSFPARSVYPLNAFARTVSGDDRSILTDRLWNSGYQMDYTDGGAYVLDLGRVMSIDRLVLCSPHQYHDDLPTSFRVEVSNDGEGFTTVSDVDGRFAVAYTELDRVYMKGYFGVLETSLRGTEGRYIRFTPVAGAAKFPECVIDEIFVFERISDTPVEYDVLIQEAARAVHEHQLSFVFANRSLSAALIEAFGPDAPEIAFPRYNPKYGKSLQSRRLVPASGIGVLVTDDYAGECRRVLEGFYGPGVIQVDVTLTGGSLLVLAEASSKDDTESLIWNGHTLLGNVFDEPAWH